MAQIDLKFATVEIRDGFSGTFRVNNVAGYSTSAVTMTIDGYTGALAVGDKFTIAGETGTPVHTISAHTETSGNTTSITFAPALASDVADDVVCTLKPHAIEINIGDGNLEYTEKRTMEYKLNKGKLDYVRLADEEPMEVSMDFVWEFLTGATADTVPTIEDALKKINKASHWVTSGSDPCEPYAVDIVVTYTPPCSGADKETIVLEEYRYEELQHNFRDAQVATSGKCNVLTATVTRG